MPGPEANKPESNETDKLRTSAALASLEVLSAAEEKALADFDCWMDRELEKLVARWSHLASPNAAKSRGFGRHNL
jgi:hypothetical protein